jgi:hypothetical protein
MKQLSILLGSLLLSGTPVFADVGPIPVAFKDNCMGSDEMADDYRIQKSSIATVWAIFSMLNMQTEIGKRFFTRL